MNILFYTLINVPFLQKYSDTSKMINLVETDVKILEKDEAIIKLLLNETVVSSFYVY